MSCQTTACMKHSLKSILQFQLQNQQEDKCLKLLICFNHFSGRHICSLVVSREVPFKISPERQIPRHLNALLLGKISKLEGFVAQRSLTLPKFPWVKTFQMAHHYSGFHRHSNQYNEDQLIQTSHKTVVTMSHGMLFHFKRQLLILAFQPVTIHSLIILGTLPCCY